MASLALVGNSPSVGAVGDRGRENVRIAPKILLFNKLFAVSLSQSASLTNRCDDSGHGSDSPQDCQSRDIASLTLVRGGLPKIRLF